MTETTDLEQIAALEHRITTALDRIARGVAARAAASASIQPGEDQSEMQERLAALSAALEETQAALQSEQSANADLNERLRAVEAARHELVLIQPRSRKHRRTISDRQPPRSLRWLEPLET